MARPMQKNDQINIRLSTAEKKAIEAQAQKKGLNVSDYLRAVAVPKTK
jgi:predicted DNA binding CopG/RHH family protein